MKTQNNFNAGNTVTIGFIKDLKVVGRTAYGSYLLTKGVSYYDFMPHQGLSKIMGSDNIERALKSIR